MLSWVYECMQCGMKGLEEDFTTIRVDPSRMEVGDLWSNLQCNDCGALAMPADPHTAKNILDLVRDTVKSMSTDIVTEAKEALLLTMLRCDCTQFDRVMRPYLDEIKRLCPEEDRPTVDSIAMGMIINHHALGA